MAKAKKFPVEIIVKLEVPANDEPWLNILDNGIEDVEESGTEVAVYGLLRVETVTVTKTVKRKITREA